MSKLPDVSIIVLTHNRRQCLEDCLSSLKKINYPKKNLEMILVDNGSIDDSVEYTRKKFPEVKILKLNKDYGYGIGINRGARIASGKYLVFLPSDTKVERNWLIELIKVIDTDEKVGACSPKILYYSNHSLINTIGGFWSILGVSGSLGEKRHKNEFNNVLPIFFPSGCCTIIRKSLFHKLGGFDQYHFLYVEDADLGWRLWNYGYKVLSVPRSAMYHKANVNIGGLPDPYYFYNTRNRLFTIIKNTRGLDTILMFTSSLFFHFIQAIVFFFIGNFSCSLQTIKGMMNAIRDINIALKKREKVIINNSSAKKMMLNLKESIDIFRRKFSKHFE